MEGDGSTTDATQLGITGEFMAGGTYVLQAQDGKDVRFSLIMCFKPVRSCLNVSCLHR